MGPRPRCDRRRVDGVLLLDKPPGLGSNAALQIVRRLYRAAKTGHTGTLDPLATGLLPLVFGEATKFGAGLLEADKTYAAEIALGATTATGDAEGEVIERRPVTATRADVERIACRFRGAIAQVPPMYSALKRDGRPLYAYARAGESVERSPRAVTIHELNIDAFEGERLAVTVRCSKGTYVRVLAEDIGRELGCGAHLAGLRRIAIGRFVIAEALTLPELERLSPADRDARLRPVDAMVGDLPAVSLDAGSAERFAHGHAIDAALDCPGSVRVYRAGAVFLGTGEVGPAGTLYPRRLIRQEAAPRVGETGPLAIEPCEGR